MFFLQQVFVFAPAPCGSSELVGELHQKPAATRKKIETELRMDEELQKSIARKNGKLQSRLQIRGEKMVPGRIAKRGWGYRQIAIVR